MTYVRAKNKNSYLRFDRQRKREKKKNIAGDQWYCSQGKDKPGASDGSLEGFSLFLSWCSRVRKSDKIGKINKRFFFFTRPPETFVTLKN